MYRKMSVVTDSHQYLLIQLTLGGNCFHLYLWCIVRTRPKQFLKNKFWWNEELNLLKEAAVQLNNLWKSAGKPGQGPICNKRQLCRAQYREGMDE